MIFLVCFIAAWIFLARHNWGRELYSIGGNEEAARLSGVSVRMAKFLAYTFSGLMCAVAGICQAAQETQGDPEAGDGYELIADRHGRHRWDEPGGRAREHGLHALGHPHHRLSPEDPQHQCGPGSRPLMITGIIIVLAVLTQKRRIK